MSRPGRSEEVIARARTFLKENASLFGDTRAFLARQFDAGLAWAHFGEGVGGLGASFADHQAVVDMFAEACTGNKSPKDAAHDAAERVKRYYSA